MIRSALALLLLLAQSQESIVQGQTPRASGSGLSALGSRPGPVSPFGLSARLTVPGAVAGAAGQLVHVQGSSPAKVFVWLPGSDGLDVFTPAPGVDQSQCGVRATKAGTYRLWCVAVLGDRTATGLVTVTITGTAPAPAPTPPAPTPDPAPKPPAPSPPAPSPPVAPVGKLFVIVVETPAGAPQRGQMFADPALSAYMRIKGNQFRIVDSNVIGPDGKPPADVAPYLKRAQGNALPQCYIVTAAGTVLYADALPPSADALLALLKKVGG